MTRFSNPFLRIHAGITLTPEMAFTAAKPLKLEADLLSDMGAAHGYAARVITSGAQNVVFNAPGGMAFLAGVAQIEDLGITAAAGATAAGNLTVTVTSARVNGAQVAVPVALTPAAHPTALAVAQAVADKLNATAAVAAWFIARPLVIAPGEAAVRLTSRHAFANDATLNMAVPATLGITAVTNSSNQAAGVAGVLVQRLGGNTEDALGQAYPPADSITGLVVSVPKESPAGFTTPLGAVFPGQFAAKMAPNDFGFEIEITGSAVNPAIADVLVFTK